MPHQCTNCGHAFADGSKEMLSGCPECGGNKFQFYPGEIPDDAEPSVDDEEPPERPDSGVPSAVGKAAATVRDFVSDDDSAPGGAPETGGSAGASETDTRASGDDVGSGAADASDEADANAADTSGAAAGSTASSRASETEGPTDDSDAEDTAQASARSEMVTSDDLPSDPPSEGRIVKEPDADAEEPDMAALREELNEQFESIKVLAPGQYELNLMELYDREEYIIALQENGRYVIEVPETFANPESRDE